MILPTILPRSMVRRKIPIERLLKHSDHVTNRDVGGDKLNSWRFGTTWSRDCKELMTDKLCWGICLSGYLSVWISHRYHQTSIVLVISRHLGIWRDIHVTMRLSDSSFSHSSRTADLEQESSNNTRVVIACLTVWTYSRGLLHNRRKH